MKKSKFTIKEKDLATWLSLTPEKLDEIVLFFDSIPDDEWELIENVDYIISSKKWNTRIFSKKGAYSILRYVEFTEKFNIKKRFIEFFTRHRARLRKRLIENTIYQNNSSLVKRNNHHYLSKTDVVKILGTSYKYFKKCFHEIQKTELPLEFGKDFEEVDGVMYFSLNALYILSKHMSTHIKDVNRRMWFEDIEVIGNKTFLSLISEEESTLKRINKAKSKAKRRDTNTCQITGKKSTKHERINLAGHHIYSAAHYSHLVDSVDNIITIDESIHSEFHEWKGGTKEKCTADDLIDFINTYYPDGRSEVISRLYKVKGLFKITD